MPANRTLRLVSDDDNVDGEIAIDVELHDKESGVYFTDEELKFDIVISNNSDHNLTGPIVETTVAIGDGKPDVFYSQKHQDLKDIPGGSELRIDESVDALVLEGHAKVGIATPSLPGRTPIDNTMHFKSVLSRQNDYEPLASFTIWDREHYREIHERPQEMQEVAAFTSIAVVFLAVLQLGAVVGYPVTTSIVALAIAGYYLLRYNFLKTIFFDQ